MSNVSCIVCYKQCLHSDITAAAIVSPYGVCLYTQEFVRLGTRSRPTPCLESDSLSPGSHLDQHVQENRGHEDFVKKE